MSLPTAPPHDYDQTASPPPLGPPAPPPAPPRVRLGWRQYLAVALVAGASSAAVAIPIAAGDAAPTTTAATTTDTAAPPATLDPGSGTAIAAIADAVSPAVVRIDAAGLAGASSGSGVVYRADGYIVTNNHVVQNARQLFVTLPDGIRLEAELVGTDPQSDLAVLRVEADGDLPVAVFATEDPRVGDTAVAIGSPFGLDGSVTAGIVSAVNRTVTAQGAPLVDLIQTDAAINPGNSGGALANGRGQVIGINTVIATAGGGSDGIGFAIPASTVARVADQLIATGTVQHAYLGITGATVTPEIAAQYGLAAEEGAVIGTIAADSPAAAAELQPGDIVVAVGDTPVTTFPQLAGIVQGLPIGETVTLTVVRGGDEITVDVTPAPHPTG
jgi:S1-C subfamily serine protease